MNHLLPSPNRLAIITLAFNAAAAASTYWAMTSGAGIELSPRAITDINTFGLVPALLLGVLQLAAMLGVCLALWWGARRTGHRRLAYFAELGVVILFLIVLADFLFDIGNTLTVLTAHLSIVTPSLQGLRVA